VSDTIFLLGAGASHDAKLPLMDELTSQFREWLHESGDAEKRTRYLPLFDAAVRAVSPTGTPNIELVLSLLGTVSNLKLGPAARVVTKWQPPFDGEPHEAAALTGDIREYISTRLRKVNPTDGNYLTGLLDFHDSDEPLDVFTMNYDRLVESMAARFGFRFTTGFGDVWDPGLFDSEKRWAMRVFKLHGSVDWYRVPGTSVIYQGAKEHYAFPKSLPVEVLLYPAESKEAFAEPFATLMSWFTRALSTAKFCIAVGYSFRDAHIRRTVLDRLGTNPALQLLIVDPRAEYAINLPPDKDEPAFRDFPDRVSGLWFPAKRAFEDRIIRSRINEILSADRTLQKIIDHRSHRVFPSAAQDFLEIIALSRIATLPGKPTRVLRQPISGEFREALGTEMKLLANAIAGGPLLGRPTLPYGSIGSRPPAYTRSEPREHFASLVALWLLANGLEFEDVARSTRELIGEALVKNLSGLLILEDGRCLGWPDALSPRGTGSEAVLVINQGKTFAGFHNELEVHPPQMELALVPEEARKQYTALLEGLATLETIYELLRQGVRRIRNEPSQSFLVLSPPTAWRSLVSSPLDSSTLGKAFARLETSGLLATWLPQPPFTDRRDRFAEQ
jgi:hypothetical protein